MPNIKYAIKDAIQSVPVLYRLVRRVRRGCNRALRDDWAGQQRLYGQFIGRDDLVFDVGANKGNKSEVFASLGARVVAYEPIPACAELTARRCPSSRVSVQRVAVSSEAGTARLWIVDNASQVASIEEEWTADVSGQCRTFIDVATTTLNAEIAKHGRPQFLKIDVEGHELAVLQGLSHPVPAISIEWHHRPSDIEKVDNCVASDLPPEN